MTNDKFCIGISSDFQLEIPGILEPILDNHFGSLSYVEYEYFPGASRVVVQPDQISNYDALITLRPRFTVASFAGLKRLVLIARWGVGYDMVDLPACTKANVLLTITGDAVAIPVAEAILTLFLALAKKLPLKERIARSGRWDLKAQASGLGLRGKVVGSLGLGGIASEMFNLLKPFRLARMIVYDPYIPTGKAAGMGVELVTLENLFNQSDFLAINCPLNDTTKGLVDWTLLTNMKPSAYLVNTARGSIVNQDDLIQILSEKRIAGAGLDVFEEEPLPASNPLTKLENVILSPHGLAWSDDLYQGNTIGVCESILAMCQGEIPRFSVNSAVLDRPGFQKKQHSLRERWKLFNKEEGA